MSFVQTLLRDLGALDMQTPSAGWQAVASFLDGWHSSCLGAYRNHRPRFTLWALVTTKGKVNLVVLTHKSRTA